MKSIFRKIAFVLALVMVVTMFPVMNASAAVKDNKYVRTVNATLFVGGDVNGDYAGCWATGKAAKTLVTKNGYKSNYTTDDEDGKVITVSKYGYVEAVGVGKATVTVTFSKKGEKDIVESFDVTVKKNAVSVTLEKEIEDKVAAGLTVGDKFTLAAVQTDADGSTEGVTDAAKFTVVNPDGEGNEVLKYDAETKEVEAVKAGKATIIVRSWQWAWDRVAKKNVSTPTTDEVKFEVEVKEAVPNITNAKMESVTKIVLDVENVTADDLKNLKITNEYEAPLNVLFKDPVLSEDGKNIVLERYSDITNGETLRFAFGEGEKFELVAKVGELASISIVGPATAVMGADTPLNVKFLDANGLELSAPSTGVSYTIDDSTYAFLNGAKVTIYEVGRAVKVQAIYDTGKFNADWTPIYLKSNEFTITCVEATAATATGMFFKLNGANVDYSASPMTIYINTPSPKLLAQVKLSNNTAVASAAGFTFETLNPSVLLVNAATGDLVPVSAGTAKVLVKYEGSPKINGVATVEVRANQELRSVTADKASATVSNATAVGETAQFTFTGHDQYGQDYDVSGITGTVTKMSAPTKLDGTQDDLSPSLSGKTLSCNPVGHVPGTYAYRVSYNNINVFVNIVVRQPVTNDLTQATSYRIVPTTGNVTVDPKDFAGSAAYSFKIVAQDSTGVAFAVVNSLDASRDSLVVRFGNVEYKNLTSAASVSGVYTVNFTVTGSAVAASGSSITSNVPGGRNVVTNGMAYEVKEGDFVVSGTYNNRTIVPATGNVSVKKSAPTVKVTGTEIAINVGGLDTGIRGKLEVDNSKYTILDLAMLQNVGTGRQYVLLQSVRVSENLGDGKFVIHTVNVNRYFSVTVQ